MSSQKNFAFHQPTQQNNFHWQSNPQGHNHAPHNQNQPRFLPGAPAIHRSTEISHSAATYSGQPTFHRPADSRGMQQQAPIFHPKGAPVYFNGPVTSVYSKSHFGQNEQNDPRRAAPAAPRFFGSLPVPQPSSVHSPGTNTPRFGNQAANGASNSAISGNSAYNSSAHGHNSLARTDHSTPFPAQLSPNAGFTVHSPAPTRPTQLSWKETVICNNVDASKHSEPPSESHTRLPTPPATQVVSTSYAPIQMPKTVHILNGTQQPPAASSIPHESQIHDPFSPPGTPAPSPTPRLGDTSGGVNGNDASNGTDDEAQVSDAAQRAEPAGSSRHSRLGAGERSLRKATAALKRKRLNEATSKFQSEQEKLIEVLAEEHDVSVSKFKKLAGSSQHHLRKRSNSAWDAIVHAKSQELNADRPKGDRLHISEIRQAAKRDKSLMAAKKDKKKLEVLMENLSEYQQQKKDVAKISNKVGTSRATKLLHKFDQDFQSLHEATELSGFSIFTRGSFKTTIKPMVIGSGPVRDFFRTHFKKEVYEIALMFESFVMTYNKVGTRKLVNSEKAKQTVAIILEGLRNITGEDRIVMNYANYSTKIVAKYKIDIVGWPESVPKESPREIKNKEALDSLYEAWSSGMAYWVKMSEREYKKFMKKLDADIEAGIVVEPGHKQRSDAGGTHAKPSKKRQRPAKDAAQAGPSKRR
ncbi:hypothetical protein BDP27DRAFT_1374506 [Rhodocollybia butyracea]|uniref:Uncharacterized protein n=1 Tax=Rhodocollybia butyracea TaxID=206335 RepID=A0A9P5P6K0_9AGAR|nr:hypothetical protein BDP27DRAFT_1374506 [Rhodocollybia butyracea]